MRTTFKVEKFRLGQGAFIEELGGYYTTVKGLAIVGEKDSWHLLHIPSGRLFGIHVHSKRLSDLNLLLGELINIELNWDVPIEEIQKNKELYVQALKDAINKGSLWGKYPHFVRARK